MNSLTTAPAQAPNWTDRRLRFKNEQVRRLICVVTDDSQFGSLLCAELAAHNHLLTTVQVRHSRVAGDQTAVHSPADLYIFHMTDPVRDILDPRRFIATARHRRMLVLIERHAAAWIPWVLAFNVRGCLLTSEISLQLVPSVVEAIACSDVVVHGPTAQKFMNNDCGDRLRPAGNPVVSFSARETQILGLLTSGRTCREVATIIGISEKTVQTYVSRIKSKVGVDSMFHLGLALARHDLDA